MLRLEALFDGRGEVHSIDLSVFLIFDAGPLKFSVDADPSSDMRRREQYMKAMIEGVKDLQRQRLAAGL